jgi:hypothetical protein
VEGEARLADPARSGERQQPDAGRVQQVADRGELRLAAEERRGLRRQVVRPVAERRKRREIARERGMDELEEVLRPRKVLQSMLSQVAHAGLRRQPFPGQLGGERRQQHLASVGGRHDPGRAIHRGAVEVARSSLRFADVDPHPHAEGPGLAPGLGLERALRLESGVHRIAGGREGGQ